MEIKGKLVTLLPTVTYGKEGKKKGGFVIQVQSGNRTNNIAFTVLGNKLQEANDLKVGSEVIVDFDVSSREYQGKWYTDVVAWKFQSNAQTKKEEKQFQATSADDDGSLPF